MQYSSFTVPAPKKNAEGERATNSVAFSFYHQEEVYRIHPAAAAPETTVSPSGLTAIWADLAAPVAGLAIWADLAAPVAGPQMRGRGGA